MARSTTPSKTIILTDIVPTVRFAGIDFHKHSFMVTLGDVDGQVILQQRVPSNPDATVSFFAPFAGISCAIENCRANEWFVEVLKEVGCKVSIANTYAVKLITESRRKTDKIDSKILMELLAKGFLPTCYQPTREERVLKERLNYRVHLLNSRTQYVNKAHALLDKESKGSKLRSRKDRAQADSEHLSPERQFLFSKYCDIIDQFELAIAAEDRWIEQTAKTIPDATRLRTAPGVGAITALLFIAEVGEIGRFKRASCVSAYFGLVPRLYESSNTKRLGPITKQGSRIMRRILIQAAWVAIRKSPELRHKYTSIMRRRGKSIAIVAIARKLVEICFCILRDKTSFDHTKLTLG